MLCRTGSPAIARTRTRNLDLARSHCRHRRHRRLALRTLAGRLSRLRSGRVAATAGAAGSAVFLRCGRGRLASCRGTESVVAILARKMATTTARGDLSLGRLACRTAIVARAICTCTGTRTATATARRLLVGRTLAAIIASATALAALRTLFAPVLTRALATMACRRLGHQAIGAGKAIAHVDARLAVEFHKGKRDVRGTRCAPRCRASRSRGGSCSLLLGALLAAFGAGHIGKVHTKNLAALQAQNQLLARRVVLLDPWPCQAGCRSASFSWERGS